jgi:hypothetical protein
VQVDDKPQAKSNTGHRHYEARATQVAGKNEGCGAGAEEDILVFAYRLPQPAELSVSMLNTIMVYRECKVSASFFICSACFSSLYLAVLERYSSGVVAIMDAELEISLASDLKRFFYRLKNRST